MRDLIVTQNITLDGVIEMTGDWFRPGEVSADQLEAEIGHRRAADAFLCGRRTFTDMRGYWPQQENDRTGVTDYLNRVHKYVVSSTLGDPEWENSTVLSGPMRQEVSALKATEGQDIVVTGSITLVHQLIDAALVDEYRLFVYPVVVGSGRRLFEKRPPQGDLQCVEARLFDFGVALQRFRVLG